MAQISVTELKYIAIITTIIFSIITLYTFIIKFFKSSAKTVHHLPPGPKPWPILGNIPHMLSSNDDPHVILFNLSRIYGPLIYLRLGTKPLIVASSPESAREILKSKDRIFSGRSVPRSVPFTQSQLNQSSFAWAEGCDEYYWKLVRTLSRAELFSNKAIESQAELREKNINDLIGLLRARENRVLKISEIVFAVVFNILGNAMMSRDFISWEEVENNADDGLVKVVSRELIEIMASPNISDFYPIFSGFDLQGLRKKLQSVYARLRGVWEPLIDERRKARADDGDSISYSRCHDFLDVLLDNDLANDQITLLFTELFMAGSDTTTSTIEWTLAELLKSPELMAKVRKDIEGEIDQDFPRKSHLLSLPYLQACVKETLRLHPPAPLLLPHRATETCQVMNYTIPKDAQVVVNAWAIGRDPDSWVEPLGYNPERFLMMDSGVDFKGSDFKFLPFGSGRRICPGMPMAAKSVPLILVALIHFFDWSIPQGTEINMSEKFGVTIQMEHPLTLIPKSRR